MTSKTLLFTLAGACALPISLSAQASEVQIYGTFLPFVDHVKTSGATAPGLSPANGGATQVAATAYTGDLGNLPARNRMTSGTSNLGFRGSFKVNDDLKIIWQIESVISPDGDAPNSLTSRNSSHLGGFADQTRSVASATFEQARAGADVARQVESSAQEASAVASAVMEMSSSTAEVARTAQDLTRLSEDLRAQACRSRCNSR